MNQERAQEAIENDCLLRTVRAYKFHHASFRNWLVDFLYSVLDKAGTEYIDVSKLINLTLSEYPAVQEWGMKAICLMSAPQEIDKHGLRYEKDRIDVAFHVHISFLIEWGKSIRHSTDFKNYTLQTLANLCQRAYLKPYILYNDGIGWFLDALKNEYNLAGRRIAAKALSHLVEGKFLAGDCIGDEKLRVRIITSLSEEVKQTWMHEVDSVIGTYIRRILRSET